ncbi:hypothetical protein RHODO2019_10500 [Rhodococcus antarcticus]|uniref:Uncharacterized protein n=1 Tax=Rhodococcus antarcticus TaxID=2987751 RepID=A0ABY6NWA2_9NOCA|nr:hypothetical protein [Rhodococcus antarcticus]UZJ23645.1 hypothetical protein RHODO2019_10500 [Rhodococcus antarcticus]
MAWGTFVVTVPSAVWRVLMIVGLMPGTTDLRQFELAGDAAFAYGYVVTLSVVQLTAGFLTVGLVRPWGERLLGRRVPLAPVLVVATLGGLAVVWLFDISMVGALLSGQRPDAGLVSGLPLAVMVTCYAPILLWGPLELAATAGYGLRRRPRRRPPHHHQEVLPTGGKQPSPHTANPSARSRATPAVVGTSEHQIASRKPGRQESM